MEKSSLSNRISGETFRTTVHLGMNLLDAQQQRISQLNELDEICQDVIQ
jgi:hypothetical protein